jgi:hypothetical protein
MQDDDFQTDFSFLQALNVQQVEVPVQTQVRTPRTKARVRVIHGFEYQMRGVWYGKSRPEFSDEHRAKIAQARSQQVITDETRAKISTALKGRTPVGQTAAAKARSRVVVTPHGEFSSIAEAQRVLKQDVVKRIRKGYDGYYFKETK